MTIKAFQKKIYDFYAKQKRSLPWRTTRDPYKILVSEVMLQQTQTSRVIPKYKAFLKAFPTVQVLASASLHQVLALWQGLGYNRRALLLKKTAESIIKDYKGTFPKSYDELLKLPGIGPYTASAIMAFAYNKPIAMIETNIRSVFLHLFFKGKKRVSDRVLMSYIEKYMDSENPREWYNALMDYGAMLKATIPNPSRTSAHHVRQSTFKGSIRQVRGAIIKAYTGNPSLTKGAIIKRLPYGKKIVDAQYKKLAAEGFFK